MSATGAIPGRLGPASPITAPYESCAGAAPRVGGAAGGRQVDDAVLMRPDRRPAAVTGVGIDFTRYDLDRFGIHWRLDRRLRRPRERP
jgi:hypothetical protein